MYEISIRGPPGFHFINTPVSSLLLVDLCILQVPVEVLGTAVRMFASNLILYLSGDWIL